MTTIHDAYINALLADAAYVDKLTPGLFGDKLAEKLSKRMTPTLANYIGEHFSVVTQIGNLASSFEATVWKEKETGKLYVSMRGTNPGVDFLVDVDLALTGNARIQLIDMVNWWLQATTPLGQSARQIKATLVLEPTPPLFLGFAFAEGEPVSGTESKGSASNYFPNVRTANKNATSPTH